MKLPKNYTIGVDIGGTNMRSILFDGKKIIADYLLATPKDSLEHFLIMLKALVEPLLDEAKKQKITVKGIGLGCAGVMNADKTKILKSPNIAILDGIALAKETEKLFNLPVKMENDTRCFLRGEMKQGAGKDYHNAFGLTIGTGIGGSWWQNNEAYAGAHDSASEPGRMIIDFQKPRELEAVYHELTQKDPLTIANQALRAEPVAKKAFDQIGRYLGLALANIVNILDPEVIIIGGGVAGASDLFLKQAQTVMNEYTMSTDAKKIKIIKGKLGDKAGAIGATLLVD